MSQNTSASGGYLNSVAQQLPQNLTFTQFLQVVLVGISGFDGTLVRPEWQRNPPKRPTIETDWLAFGVAEVDAPGFPSNAMAQTNPDDPSTLSYSSQYHERVTLQLSMYGPEALSNFRALRDGFYLPQNNQALVSAGFGLVGFSKAIRNPELISEQWFNRFVFSIDLRYQESRTYPILNLTSASGIIWAPISVDNNFHVPWLVQSA